MKGGFAALAVILVVIVAGLYVVPRIQYGKDATSGQQSASSTADQAPRTFAWKFSYASSTDAAAPRSQVALITGGDIYDVGTYAGSCNEIAPKDLLPGEVSAVLCWWAGGGDELGVFRNGSGYVVRLGSQDEPTAETPGARGGFKELFILKS